MNRTATDSPLEAPPLARISQVSKWYGAVIALNNVSLQLTPGVTGLIGPNGAGKSSLIKLVTGQLRPSLGTVTVAGHHAWSAAAKRHVGYCPDSDNFYEEMSGRRFVETMAGLHGMSREEREAKTDAILTQVGMRERADRPLAGYSKGMRQRIKLAQALIHDPDIVVLDEPLNGIDPAGRIELSAAFRRLADEGKGVLVSSHILEEMEQLADRVLFICRGRILAAGTLAEVRGTLSQHPLQVRLMVTPARVFAQRLLESECVLAIRLEESGSLRIEVEKPEPFFETLARLMETDHFEIERLQVMDTSAEAIFQYLMQESWRP
jgi:ABC-2 type transport system ATP-binding protein